MSESSEWVDVPDGRNIHSRYSQHAGCPFQEVRSSLFTDLITDNGISLAGIYHKAHYLPI